MEPTGSDPASPDAAEVRRSREDPRRGDPALVDLASLEQLRTAFRSAAQPTLADLGGAHEAQFIGPAWLRSLGPVAVRLGRMPGWCGKRFTAHHGGDGVLAGVNRTRVHGVVRDSIPITARIGPSRVDGRPALLVTYPADARFPWPRVTDELRPFGTGTLLGLTFGIPLSPPRGAPFLLHRVEGP